MQLNVSYAAGTHRTGLEDNNQGSSSSALQTRTFHTKTNWCLCLVCQQIKCKKERETSQVLTTQVYETLMRAAQCRKDDTMIQRILGTDLIALEARFRRGCYRRYTSLPTSTTGDGATNTISYDRAFLALLEEIKIKLLHEKRAFEMSSLSTICQQSLFNHEMATETAKQYKMQNLKQRLINKYVEKINFYPPKCEKLE